MTVAAPDWGVLRSPTSGARPHRRHAERHSGPAIRGATAASYGAYDLGTMDQEPGLGYERRAGDPIAVYPG